MRLADVTKKTTLSKLDENRLRKIEAGEIEPTISEVMEFARIFKRPFPLFFLPEPPSDVPVLLDKRTGLGHGTDPGGDLSMAIARAQEVQDFIAGLSRSSERSKSEVPVPDSSEKSDPEKLAAWARRHMGIERVFEKSRRDSDEALAGWILEVEKIGIIVLQETFSPKGTSAFSIGEYKPPILVLCFKDAARRRIFSLFHELAHIFLRQSVICNLAYERTEHDEKFCDKFSAAFLMPEDEVRSLKASLRVDMDRLAEKISAVSGASIESAFLRLVDLNITTFDEYLKRKPYWDEAYAGWLTKQQQKGGGPNPNPVGTAIKKGGRTLSSAVGEAFQSGSISRADASSIMRLPAIELPTLIKRIRP